MMLYGLGPKSPVLVGELSQGVGPCVAVSRFELGGSIEPMRINTDAISSDNVAHGQYVKEFAALVK